MNPQNIPVNSIRLCIEHCTNSRLEGRIIGVALKSPVYFSGLRSFITKVDEAFDTIGKPQPHQITRSFRDTDLKPAAYSADPPRYHESKEILSQSGTQETIDLVMITRQHTEWQGLLKDTDGGIIGRFSSVLGCIQLITGSVEHLLT